MARHFANWLKAYMTYTQDSESPTAFHFWTGVSTVAGALRRRVWVDMRKFQWTPNFYVFLIGPPGIAAKSTSTRAGMALLEAVNEHLSKTGSTASGIKFGPQSGTWQALTESLEQSMEYTKYIDVDGTEQSIPNSSITIAVPEAGTFFKMDDNALMDVMVSLWDGQLESWSHKTKASGNIEIKNPWLNIIACTTPSWLQNNFPEHMIGGGFTSRVVFVYGDAKRHLVAYPDEVTRSAEYLDHRRKLIEDLAEISQLAGPYELTREAREWGRQWYQKLWKGPRPSHMASDRYSGYIARKQTHMHKLAIILAASKRSQLIIEARDLQEADQLLTDVEPHMLKVFESVGMVDEARQIVEIKGFVRNYGFCTSDDLWRYCMNTMDQRSFTQALQVACQSGILRVVTQDGKRGVVLSEATRH